MVDPLPEKVGDVKAGTANPNSFGVCGFWVEGRGAQGMHLTLPAVGISGLVLTELVSWRSLRKHHADADCWCSVGL